MKICEVSDNNKFHIWQQRHQTLKGSMQYDVNNSLQSQILLYGIQWYIRLHNTARSTIFHPRFQGKKSSKHEKIINECLNKQVFFTDTYQ